MFTGGEVRRGRRVLGQVVRVVAFGALVAGSLAWGSADPVVAADGTCSGTTTVTCTFAFTGCSQTFTVPANVTSLTVELFGAQGGAGSACTQPPWCVGSADGTDGNGAHVTATVPVTAGQVLGVLVGGNGTDATPTTVGVGGFGFGTSGGGGQGGPNQCPSGGGGGGGSATTPGAPEAGTTGSGCQTGWTCPSVAGDVGRRRSEVLNPQVQSSVRMTSTCSRRCGMSSQIACHTMATSMSK